MRIRYKLPLVLLVLGISACKTYLIPVASFKQQFAPMRDTALRAVRVQGPLGGITTYHTYPIEWIECVDKKGHLFRLRNSPSVEIRFTDTNHKRTVFYFDRMRVTDTSVTGSESRILPSIHKTVSLNAVTKIEVQDGKKRYHYVTE